MSHVSADRAGPDDVRPPSRETVQAHSTQPPQGRPAHKDPEQIGQYRILGKIGEGGMGVVYRAEQREPVRRVVALKVIKLGMDTSEVVARFEAERQALALMNHPNVAKVLEAGITETGRPFFAMELVPGIDFTRYCEDEKLSIRQRLELFIPVCQAIQHAHQKGIIHRDLKPSNVLVQLVDGKPVPKVIDFGIAKATNQALTQHTLFTQTGAMIGTPEYMSPEQAMTSGLDVDTRTDIYSLGVILYQVLTGTLPLDPKALREAGMEGMARLIKTAEPQKPSTRLLTVAGTAATEPTSAQSRITRLLQKELRGDLDWIVLKATEKDRARRYETANALAMDLQRHLDNEPVLARPPSASYRVQKFVSRHRVGVLAGSAVMLALLVGLTLSSLGFVRARAERDRANTARVEAQTQRDIADKARIEAQTQRKIAEDQKQLAVENAKKADENATKAELRLASGLVSQADTFSLASRFSEAHQLYIDAYAKFVELKQPLTVPEAGLWSSYEQTTFPLLSFSGHTGNVASVAIAPDGRTAISGSGDKTLKLWDVASGKELRTFTGHNGVVTSVAISPDGRTALSGSGDKTLKLWDLASGKELRTFTGHTAYVTCVALSPDGRTSLSGSGDKTLKLWDLASGKELRTFTGHGAAVISIAIAPDGRTALSCSDDKTLKLWDVASGKELRTFTGHNGVVTSVAISPDGRTALSGSADKTLKLWDLASGKELRTFTGHNGVVTSVAISPDGRTALSGSGDKTLKLWDLASGKERRTFTGHNGLVASVAISPDGRTALSGSGDGLLKLWDLASGRELRTLTGHTDWVLSVALSADGRTALSGSREKTLKLWDFARGTAHLAFEPRVAAAQAKLQQAPNDPAALATLGEWYAFHGMDPWAVEFLTRAREGGAAVEPLTLARCYSNLNRNDEARREFQIALEHSPEAAERTYLERCITGIDTEPQRKRQQEAVRQLAEAKRLGEQGHLKEAGDLFIKVIQQSPDEHWAWYYHGCLLAYQQDVEGYRKHCKAMLERFGGSNDPQIAERTAKTCLLLPGGGDARQLLATADRVLTGVAGNTDLQSWFNLLGALARYRTGDYRGCLESAQACKDMARQDTATRTATADLLLAMANQQRGQPDKANAALDLALDRIGKHLPMLSEEHPASGNLDNWLICQTLRREAQGVVGMDNPTTHPQPAATNRSN